MRTGNRTIQGKDIYKKDKCRGHDSRRRKGRLFLVGIGPGSLEDMTIRGEAAIRESDVIVGYKKYTTLIDSLLKGKEVLSCGMTKEVERCKSAILEAGKGRCVSLISSGDIGIYGMAGLVYELAIEDKRVLDLIDIEVIPGVSAINAAASSLGAPLMNDFAVISLSDLLTPLPVIEKRIRGAASADFVIVLLNPKSNTRTKPFDIALEILMELRGKDTIIGIVKDAKRKDEHKIFTTLSNLDKSLIDMSTTVIVGNSDTVLFKDIMVTKRGYPLIKEKS